MQMHFKKCTLVLKPEVMCFAYKTVVFSLQHQHIEISRVHLTFFEWFWHRSAEERTRNLKLLDSLGGSIFPDLPLYLTYSSSCINISILLNDVHSPTYPKKETWVPSWLSLSLHWPLLSPVVLTPPSSICLLLLVQDTKISCLDDNSGFLNDLPHANLNLKSDK